MSIKKLPPFLVARYKDWRANDFEARREHYEALAQGQSPAIMVISCCDSRVNVADILHAQAGEFFIHRNIANLVPPYTPSGDFHGTSAAVEYAVCALAVKHVLVLGHAQCGGVAYCHAQCASNANDAGDTPPPDYQFVSQWLTLLEPAFNAVDNTLPHEEQLALMAKQGILNSLANLQSFPFVAKAVASGALALHGAYHDIGGGILSVYNPETQNFESVITEE